MKLSNPASGRPAYYDRAPASAGVGFIGDAVAPHGLTARGTYTTPAGILAFVNIMHVDIERRTAAAPVGQVRGRIDVAGVNALEIVENGNAVGDGKDAISNPGVVLNPAETMQLFTIDGGTGGTVDYRLRAQVTEFDQ